MKQKSIFLLGSTWIALFLMEHSALSQTWLPTTAPTMNWTSIASSQDGSKLIAGAYGGITFQGILVTIMPGRFILLQIRD